MGDELGTGVWHGFGNMGHGLRTDWAEARRKEEAFKATQKAQHKARLAERKLKRQLERGETFDGFIGPPDPRKLWGWRPPMKR